MKLISCLIVSILLCGLARGQERLYRRQAEVEVESSGDYYDEDDEDLEYEETSRPDDELGTSSVTPGSEDLGSGSRSTSASSDPNKTSSKKTDGIYLEESTTGSTGRRSRPSPSPKNTKTTSPNPEEATDVIYPTGRRRPTNRRGPAKPATDPQLQNKRPQLVNKLAKLAIIAGKSRRWRVPEGTFYDAEQGNTRNLSLSLRYENGSLIPRGFWIQFDPDRQEIRALPVDENIIGRWKFVLLAADKEGLSAQDVLQVTVRQFPGSRRINHQFQIEMAFTEWRPNLIHNWGWMVLAKLSRFFVESSYENLLVRTKRKNPFIFGWTNTSLLQSTCPQEKILAIRDVLSGMDARPSQGLSKIFSDVGVRINRVELKYYGSCLEALSTKEVEENLFNNLGSNRENNVPVMRNPIDRINVTAGEMLRFKVPQDTCFDQEDGDVSKLSLQLLTTNKKELPVNSWLKFDPNNQEFVGVPLLEEVGREEYQLVCSDRSGLSAIDGIEILVANRPFSERLDMEFVFRFGRAVGNRRVRFVELLKRFLGDGDPRRRGTATNHIVLKSFGGYEVTWFNKSLSNTGCGEDVERFARAHFYDPSNPEGREDVISPELRSHFRSMDLTEVEVVHRGGGFIECIENGGDDYDDNYEDDDIGDSGGYSNVFHGLIPANDYLLTFLVPAIIIILMVIIALLLACLLHRKRKAGKLSLFYSEALPPRVPVILQDELTEAPGQPPHLAGPGPDMYGTGRKPLYAGLPHEHDRLMSGPGSDASPSQHGSLMRGEMGNGAMTRPTPAYHY